jgi:hypothetical protein
MSTKQSKAGMFVALVPWVVFAPLAKHVSLMLASIASLALAVLLALHGLKAGKAKILDLGAVATFAGFAVVAFTADATVARDVTRYARGISAGMLSLLAFASLLFVPFTEQYARESAPQGLWGASQVKAVNRGLTTMWGLIFAAMIPFHIVAGAIDTQRANVILNFVAPGLIVLWGVKRATSPGGERTLRSPSVQWHET